MFQQRFNSSRTPLSPPSSPIIPLLKRYIFTEIAYLFVSISQPAFDTIVTRCFLVNSIHLKSGCSQFRLHKSKQALSSRSKRSFYLCCDSIGSDRSSPFPSLSSLSLLVSTQFRLFIYNKFERCFTNKQC